jgi:ABC-type polysaccharide/polyol phosphate transport system ATPase subunit
MHSDTVISIRNLGKRYVIDHQGRGSRSLKEAVTEGFRSWYSRVAGEANAPRVEHEEFWALRNVSFDVKQGEIIGIVGPNGSGKSTLLKILSRITDPTEGEVRLRGRVASLLEVGTGFRGELSGRDNVFLNGAILGLSKMEIVRRFDEIVEFAGVEKFIDTPVKHYSSGMYMRLAFSVATSLVTDILMLDEVLAVGDAEFQKKCMARVADIRRSGRTILFVSHDSSAVSGMCSRAIYLEHGEIRASGGAAQVVKEYERRVVAAYISKPSEPPAETEILAPTSDAPAALPVADAEPAPLPEAVEPAELVRPEQDKLDLSPSDVTAVHAIPASALETAVSVSPQAPHALDELVHTETPSREEDASRTSAAAATAPPTEVEVRPAQSEPPTLQLVDLEAGPEEHEAQDIACADDAPSVIVLTEGGQQLGIAETLTDAPTAVPTAVPIAARKDRQGNRAFRFIDAMVKRQTDGSSEIRSGDDALLRIWIDNPNQRSLAQVDVAVGFDNARGERVAMISTSLIAATISRLPPGWTTVDFRLRKLALAADRYSITLFGTTNGEVADWITAAAPLTVADGDFFGSGSQFPQGQGSVLIPFTASCSAAQSLPLSDRRDRKGSGAFVFDEILVQPYLGAPAARVRSGTDVVFQLSVSNRQGRSLSNVDITLAFQEETGEQVAAMTTEAIGATIDALPPGVSSIEFRCHKLPLAAGHYRLGLKGTVAGELADALNAAASIEVDDGDYYGRGKKVPANQSRLLIPYTMTSNTSPPLPLVERRDRKGNGRFRFVDSQFLPCQGHSASGLRSGVDAVFELWIENSGSNSLRNVDVAIGFDNERGERIAILTTEAVGATVTELPPGLSNIEFRMEKLPFVAGRYTYTLFGTTERAIADWVQAAGFFDVLDGDFFRTGRAVPAGQASLLIPYSVSADVAGSSGTTGTERRTA